MKKKTFKGVHIDRRFDDQEEHVNSYAAPPQPQANFDYTKFFDFGFFSNAAAGLSGAAHPSTQNGQVFSYQKQITPNTVVLHKTVVPYNHEVYQI